MTESNKDKEIERLAEENCTIEQLLELYRSVRDLPVGHKLEILGIGCISKEPIGQEIEQLQAQVDLLKEALEVVVMKSNEVWSLRDADNNLTKCRELAEQALERVNNMNEEG